MEEDSLFFYECENIVVRNNSGWVDEYFLVISHSNNSIFEENSIIQNRSYRYYYKTIFISYSHDSVIRNNDFLTDCNFLSISVCSNISIEQNSIECNGEYLLEVPEDDKLKQTDFIFRNNRITGRFRSISNRIGYIPNYFQLFTLRIPFNPLILIFTVSVGVFSTIGIVYSNNNRVITYYNRNISNGNSDSEEQTLYPFWLIPFLSSLFCCLFTFPTIHKVRLIDDFVTDFELPVNPDLFNYIIMISVWGIGLISVIIAVGRRKSEMKKQLEQPSETNFTQADKLLWVKILAAHFGSTSSTTYPRSMRCL
jgi:hypothetical protein